METEHRPHRADLISRSVDLGSNLIHYVNGKSTHLLKKCYRRLPWWLSGIEPACQCWGQGFSPWSGKIPGASEQPSPHATTTEPALQSLGAAKTELTCCDY